MIDYNTERTPLEMQEYGRGIQEMVAIAMKLPTKAERQLCAQNIVKAMLQLHPELKNQPNGEKKVWDHLAIMSHFELDIDYPYDISDAKASLQKPSPMPYPEVKRITRHYGAMVQTLIDKIVNMPEGPARQELLATVANLMKKDIVQWGGISISNAETRVANDLANLSDGIIQLDPNFRFNYVQIEKPQLDRNKKKRKRKG